MQTSLHTWLQANHDMERLFRWYPPTAGGFPIHSAYHAFLFVIFDKRLNKKPSVWWYEPPKHSQKPYSGMDWFWDRNCILAIHPYAKSLISNTHFPPNAWDNCIIEPHRGLCILYANIADLWDHIYIYIYVYIYVYTDITLEIQLTIPICSASIALNRLMYMLYYVGMLD